MGQVERRLTLALGLPAGASLSRVCAAVEAKVAAVEASNARNLDTIESVGRLERERDEARAIVVEVRKQLAVAFESSLENQRLNAELARLDADIARGVEWTGDTDAATIAGLRKAVAIMRASGQVSAEVAHKNWVAAWEVRRERDGLRVEIEAIDAALGYDEHDTRHDGDRVERIEELHERLLCAKQDRDRATAKLVETQSDLASARAESAHLALDLGPGLLDPRSERAIGIALDGIALGVGPAGVALVGVVRALCGIGVRA